MGFCDFLDVSIDCISPSLLVGFYDCAIIFGLVGFEGVCVVFWLRYLFLVGVNCGCLFLFGLGLSRVLVWLVTYVVGCLFWVFGVWVLFARLVWILELVGLGLKVIVLTWFWTLDFVWMRSLIFYWWFDWFTCMLELIVYI